MGKKIYVGNLSYSVESNQLTEVFGKFGTVESAKVITDRDSGRSKGFAFIEMSEDADMQGAIDSLNGSDLSGRAMTVSEAKPQEPRDNNSGGGNFRNQRRY